jgi:hypothetical protein
MPLEYGLGLKPVGHVVNAIFALVTRLQPSDQLKLVFLIS